MSVTSVNRISSIGEVDGDFHRTYKSVYEVVTNDRDDGPITVLSAPDLPRWRDPYQWGNDSDDYAFVTGASADYKDVKTARRVWRVSVTHSTKPVSRRDTPVEHPLDEPPKISGSFIKFTRPAPFDRFGNPVTNSASNLVVPAFEIDDSRDTVIVELNTPDLLIATRAQTRDKVNAAPFWGLPARTIKLGSWEWQILFFGRDFPYVQNKLEFEINFETWNHTFLDQGQHELGEDGKQHLIKENDEPKGVVLLDGEGKQSTDGPHYLTKEILGQADFSILPVPDPLF